MGMMLNKAGEMWFWRKMMRISWKDKLTNEVVLERWEGKTTFEHYQKEALEIFWP